MKVLSLNKAKTEEFLNRFLNENQNSDSNPFFGGIHLKNEEGRSHVKLQLEINDIQKIQEICNGSDILIYNFYCCVLSILLHKYEETSFFISPLSQFEEYAESNNQFFVLQYQLDKSENFKSIFSASKNSLLESIENSFDFEIFDDSFLNFEDFKNKISFGISINEINNDILDIVKTQFAFDFKSDNPSLDITCKGEIIDNELLHIFGDNFNKLLNETLQNLYEPISNLEFRGNKEERILSQVNQWETNFSLDKNIVELLIEQCENQSDKIAISNNDQTITYKELNQQTNRLARYIQNQFAAGKDDLFGIMLSRSINMVSGIFSVWKAGSAYVPVATNLGDDALQHIIENSNLKAIITDDLNVLEQLKGLSIEIPVIDLNIINEFVNELSDLPLNVKIGDEDLAYVIYTSGSTGKPKGAMIEHYGMLNHIMAKITEMGIDQNSIVAQNAPHTFDISVWQFFAPLVAGGTSIIYDEDTILEINEFVTRITNDKVTLLELVPSYLLEMLNYIESEDNKVALFLNILILNAETLTKGMVKRWLDAYSNIPIVNTYGATEVSDDMSHFIMHDVPKSYSVPVMKQPIQNFEVHILDENRERVPVGVKGEIYLASPCVGRGYFNDEKRTKEAFLKGPIEGITNQERIYKTGDLGRFMPNGTMEFIGRNDNQVKILGHRIELDAIENITAEIATVKSVKAIAHTDKQMIVLYYVSDFEIDKAFMEGEILKKLPKYMLPSAFIHMSNFPLTKNGKIDKNRLPSVKLEDLATKEYVAPQNETEEKLAVIWQEVLKVDRIGVTDNFFELGGHSLLAVRTINRIKKELGLNTSVKTFFENPTIVSLSKLLKEEQYIQIEKSAILNSYPLTASQHRFWVLSQVGDASLAYNLSMPLQFKGELDVSKFEESFLFLINRHESLRTSFQLDENGQVRQFITSMDDLDFSINYIDLSSDIEKEIAVAAYLAKENATTFNLEQAPLLRVSLIKVADQEYVFFMTMHHIIGDGWSSVVLFKEMVSIYNSLIESKEINLPELRIQYKDYAGWLNKESQLEHYKTSETYWLNQFSGSLPVMELPGYKKRPLVKTYNGDYLSYQFPNGFTEKLTAFSQKHDVTLFMTLMAGVNALLNRYTGQEDIIIGSPIAGREHSDLENQIGLYLNTLAFRTKTDKDFNFLDLLRHEKEVILGAYEHQGYPFDELVDNLELKRDSSRSALFDIMVVLQSQSKLNNFENDKLLGLEIKEQEVTHKKAQFDLIFAFMETDGLLLGIEYNTDIYESSFIEKIFTHFEQLLSIMIAEPQAKIQHIDYLNSEEKQRLLVDFNNTQVDYPRDKTIVELFEEQVQKTPDNIAVVFEGREIKYKELNDLSDHLAYSLKKNYKISKGDKIGIHLTRSEWLVVAILGILKSGGTYIPIDSELPNNRKAFVSEDTVLTLLITESAFTQDLDFYNGNVLFIDTEFNPFQEDVILDKINLDPTDLAYIIYTSGSTGLPKGVMIEHSSLTNYLVWAKEYYLDKNLRNTDFGLFTSMSFDLTITSFFLPLISGGCLNVLPSSDSFQNLLESYFTSDMSCVKLTPAHISVLGNLGIQSSKIQLAIVGGEELQEDHVRILKNINPDIRIVNEYGPTESTVGCTIYEPQFVEAEILIGRPVANTAIYILDALNNLQPEGVMGEICIGGSGLAKGYWNRPELTSEKFISNPFEAGSSLYKTGDLGKWLADGNLVYLGRVDDQIKIRGHRIELGEIERNLSSLNGVKQSVVVAHVKDGDKFLVAYYVSDAVLDKKALKSELGKVLPEYMLPGYYIQLDVMPLTSNGKIDRKSLPEVRAEDLIKTEYIAPRTAEEKVLAGVWSEVLKYEEIGIKDSFYNLGGDSIKSILIVSRLKQRGFLIKVDQILRNPVLEDLALLIEVSITVVDQSEVTGASVLTPIQHYFFDNETLPNKNHYNQSVLLKSKEELDTRVLAACISMLVSHHDALRMVYKEESEGWVQYNENSNELHYKIDFYDLRSESDELLSLNDIGDELQSNFDISSGILFNIGHFRLSDGDRVALIIHHLVIDGISWRILLEDLSTLYLAYQSGNSANLPLKTDSFQRWASLQQNFAKGYEMQQERPYWDGISKAGISQLPSDYINAVKFSNIDKRNGFVLDNLQTEKLQTQVHHVYKTEINDLLLTGLGLAIEEVFGVSKSAVKMEGHGREEIIDGVDIGRTVGWFTSVYPFILDVSGDKALISVKDSLRKIPNKGIGYGILNYLDAPFESSLVPSIQFNYLGDFGSNAGGSQDEVMFEFASENIGSSVDITNMQSTILLDVSGMMVAGGLSMSIGYSGERYSEETIEKLTRAYENQLKNLITELSKEKQSQLTPSDLTYRDLSIEELQQLNKDNSVEDIYELSPLQQGFYYHWLADYSSPMYFEQMAYAVNTEELSVENSKQAFRDLISRYSILRTSFTNNFGDQPLQIVHKEVESDFSYEKMEKTEGETVEEYIERIKAEDIAKGFDLAQPSLMRLKIVEVEKNRYVFIWSYHHILMDGWCMSILINEFSSILNAISVNQNINLPNPLKYSDYIKWLSKIDQQESLDYWKNYLNDLKTVVDLPFKQKKESSTSFDIKHFRFNIEGELYQNVISYCQEIGVTLNVFVQGVWGYLLSRYNNTTDVVFGTVVSGRPAELIGVETMVGLFINTIPVRVKYNNGETPKTLLKQIQSNAIGSSSHHYTNLSEVQSQSDLGSELIKTLLTFENYFVQEIEENTNKSLSNQSNYIENVTVFEQTNYDFNIIATPSAAALKIDFGYNSEVLDKSLIENLSFNFLKIASEFSKKDNLNLNEIDYLSDKEKQQVLLDFNDTFFEHLEDKTVIDLFEEQTDRTPNKIAVRFNDIELTYRELNEKANQFAHYLIESYEIQTNDIIGIKLQRSEMLIVSILGVLKSGGAYVPIDPGYPENRIEYIEKHSKCKIVINDTYLQFFEEVNEQYSKENVSIKDLYDNLAYVIYTSGSTGNPKGVAIGHKSLFNFIISIQHKPKIEENDYLFSVTTQSFDISILEFFSPLTIGASLYVASEELLANPLAVVKTLEDLKLTIIQATPSFYEMLYNAGWKGNKSIKILCGGDLLSEILAQKLLETNAELWNMYGPTETTIWSSCKKITKANEASNVGKPINNTKIYILDQFMKNLPIGCPGAIYIGGEGLAKGYFRNQELTDEKFIKSQFDQNKKVYNTGDLGCWNEKGEVEFMGRNDNQVKIRGHRIELGEIEISLLNFSNDIKQVVVDAKEVNGDKVLIAYYVSVSEINKSDLRQYLIQHLPEFMVPGFFISLPKIPLTFNGKIDRKALPDVSGKDIIKKKYIAPRNEQEESLVMIWQEILKVDKIGITDNFLELGGHSLLIVKVINRIKKELISDVSVKVFFENPTIESLSKKLREGQYFPISRVAKQNSYAVTASQQRFWVLSQFEDTSLAYNMPVVLKLKGELEISKFEESFLFLINRHEALRTCFKLNEAGQLSQFITSMDDLDFSLNYVDLSLSTEKEVAVESYLAKENSIAFNLEKAPLIRVSLIKTGDEDYVFFMTMHHIIGDGWSSELLVKEMVTIYNSLIQAKEVDLPELSIQYKDYAGWLNEELQQEHYKTSEVYWLNQFSGSLPVIELPGFNKRPVVKTYNGDSVNYQFSDTFLEKLKDFSKKQDLTLFMTLMTGINTLLSRYTGQQDIIIGSPIAGREHPDLENQIGLYLNTLALRTQIDKDFNFLDLLRHEKQVILDAYEHQSYPFDELVEKLELKRDSSRSAMFDIMVVLQSQSTLNSFENDKLSGLEVYEYETSTKVAQFDMTFTFIEQDSLRLSINYNTDIYDLSFVEQIAVHFEQLVSRMIDEPETKIQQVDYLSTREKQLLLIDFNNTAVAYPGDKTVVALFEKQVEETPEHIAVVFEDREITYKELNEEANELGHYLRDNYQIQPDDFVGIKLGRSEKLIISILGILKSGGAYVPIDANYPQDRIKYIEEDTRCKIIIDDSQWNLFKSSKVENKKGNLPLVNSPKDLAYVIYTSGTTGNPKGVMVEHKSVVRLVKPGSYFLLNESKILLSTGAISFDATIIEYFGTLLNGSKLIIAKQESLLEIATLKSIINKNKVNCLWMTATWFSQIADSDISVFETIEHLIAGGDVVSPAHTKKLFDVYKSIKITNGYGPTENTTFSLTHKISYSDTTSIPIGKPIENSTAYILDDHLQPVPVGVSGTLYVAGDGLSRGYLNKPELTAEKFIENPFVQGTKMYNTGDLAKWLPNGDVIYLGRNDDQVKIRGHRIELGEIERNIANIEGISQSVVVINEKDSDKYIVAYYVSDKKTGKKEIQESLLKKLPDYMLPSYYIQIDSIPLTSNGKADRKSLPEVRAEDLIKTEYIAPCTAEEKVLAGVWSEVLKYEEIGIKDSFYNLGGDSIKSILIVSRLKQRGFLIKVDQILRNPVLEDLALLIEVSTTVVDQSEVTGASVLTPIQHYFFDNETLPNKNHYNQSVLLKSKEELDTRVLAACISMLVSHHDALRMVYKEESEGWVQYNENSNELHYKIDFYDLRSESDELLSLNDIGDELQSNFDISSGILFNIGHFRLSDGDRVALIIHHLVIDGISWRILLEDLSTLYLAYQSGNSANLPLKTDSFQRWASLQQNFAKGYEMQQERPYWDGISKAGISQLPSDYINAVKFSNIDKRNGFVLDNLQTEKLQTQVHHVYKTEINDLLLTGLGLAIEEVFGVSKSAVKMEGHGREEIIDGVDIGRTVGWFTSVYPFILDVSGDKALISVKDSLRKIPNKGIGYGILNYLDAPFESSLVPSIQFNYLGDFGSNAGGSQDEVMFEFASENIGSSVDITNMQSTILLDVSGMMVAGGLSMSIGYSGERYSEETIEKLTRAYENQLKNLIEMLALKSVKEITDFNELPYIKTGVEWSYGDLMELSPNQKRFYKYEYSCVTMRDKMNNFNKNTFEQDFRVFLSGFPALNLKYETIDDKVFQKYIQPTDVELQILITDVSLMNEEQVLKITDEFLKKPYDLVNGPLIRCLALQEDPSGSTATITIKIHHSLLDYYSVNRIYEELCNYFQGGKIQNSYCHPFDFIVKKAEFLLSEQGLKERKYWTDTLKETPLYDNEINPGTETVNVIQETVISDERFINIKEMAKENNIPVSAFFIGFYEMILNTLNLDKRGLYSFMVNGREQEVEGMDINNILGVTDNALPLSYKQGDINMDLESILEIYISYLRNRTYQSVPYETIRKDTLEATGYDIDENMNGYLNLYLKEGSVSSKNASNQKLNAYQDDLLVFYGINLECEIYKDGVYFSLMCPKDIYEKNRDLICLDSLIQDLLKRIEVSQNSEINTF
ncbi:amino acid adenylation domain-containing protein [Flavobacterium sp. LS1R49]|uniref:Amino acid adenylation domain-containing protein n=1 Tax=Flavobacterium shii TaxID=2987687 RepID=A0A9X3BXV2_9FLAO|nr:non-ribosomal peptide synthetase [Flavobacterium shii]MCV9927835.1 amino acid adenylation domain-containing protein [Flavobacterium shii]